nr:NUDIX domain-containing protein [Salmonella enterica]
MNTYAAGILFKSGGKIFLVKRGDDGSWAVPGGKLEEG